MKKEIRIFFTAMMFFTRIPCPPSTDHSEEYLNRSSKYFPLIGIIVGSLCALVFWLASFAFSLELSLLLSMVASLLITGAFHEDGFADVCDGFGGGWTKEKILTIMKDSRVGTYGVAGLVLILALKFTALKEIGPSFIIPVLIAGHAISRLNSAILIYTDEYAREDLLSKAKPLATKMRKDDFIIAIIFGIAPLLFFPNLWILLSIIPLLLVKAYFSRYFNKWIGGYTGDCLGTVQQVSEVVFYLSTILIFKYFG
ncbi:adenosylcobinamide-GDP ribazoletransferase [Pedobacter aquae]|uniref:Adenosylcobinamide-GDP ribazoletransferase n=1 Tax=Pedobacter aquae TaxID=2605747 RepID=A0A5C0VGQ5_9SPHI|nr:adenosylcobinamide-GDP ribazoletransferase [Pedobacter aquae]QEK51053.1 adenosylcobinamide-GDP ribazoletransferase [Pedobacter aquae]